jgi:virulence factor Mce-like protein
MTGDRQARLRLMGMAFIAATGVLTVIIFSGVFRRPFEPDTRKVVVEFDHAAQLHAGDQVRLEGDIDGKVTSVKPSPTPEAARVTLAVNEDAGPIYADARARLREKTLLGGAFYVDLQRGTPGAGALGDRVITTDRTSVQTEIEDITDIFREDAVTGLQTLPGEIATSLSDPAKPVTALRTANSVAHDAGVAVDAVRGQQPGQDLPRLVHSTAKAVAALDTPTDDIRTVVSGAAATLQTTGRRAAEIEQAIQAGPGVTSDMTHTLARLDGTLGVARGLIGRLEQGVPAIAPTLRELRPTLPLTTRTLNNAKPLLREIGHTASAGGRLGKELTPVLDTATPSLKRLDKTILPYLARKDPITGYSTTVMIGGFASGFAGVAMQKDQNGHFVRFAASAGASSAYLPCSSTLIDPTAKSVLACDTFNTAIKNYLSYLPPGLTGGSTKSRGRKK